MSRILVTGGDGFIGSNFIHYWLKNYPQDKILNLDKLTYAGHKESLKDCSVNPHYNFIQGDICDTKLLEKILVGVDIVVHFAAESHVDRSVLNPLEFVLTNVCGTQNLLEASLRSKIVRFHHVSTDEVFGSLKLRDSSKFNERTNYNPRSPYSASKAGSDHLVRAYHETYGLPVTITNCSNNFGPYQDPEKFLPRMITNLIDGFRIPIYGDGKYVRDWLYVEDHCRAIDLILKKGKIGETYVVGGLAEDISNLEIAKKLLEIFGKDRTFLKFIKDRPGHDRRYAVDWQKIKKLGWKPLFGFDTWLQKTVKWYQENEWWWRPLKKEAEKLYFKTGQT